MAGWQDSGGGGGGTTCDVMQNADLIPERDGLAANDGGEVAPRHVLHDSCSRIKAQNVENYFCNYS